MRMVAIIVLSTCWAAAGGVWTRVGDARSVTIDHAKQVSIATTQPATAGVVQLLPAVAGDALLVTAHINRAAAGDVVVSLHPVAGGPAVAQFCNLLAIEQPITLATALDVTRGQPAKLFVGTHRRATAFEVSGITMTAARKRVLSRWMSWGGLAGNGKTTGQTFVPTADRLEAIEIRVRQLAENAGGPALRTRLFAVNPDGSIDRTAPLAEAITRRDQIPPLRLDAPRVLVIPLAVAVPRGKPVLVEFDTEAPTDASQAYLIYGGPGASPLGQQFDNGSARPDGDLSLTIYEAAR